MSTAAGVGHPVTVTEGRFVSGPRVTGASILPPDPADMLGWRTTALAPHLVSAVGAHGGAGVSTLAAQLDHVADSGQLWPGRTDESPFAVVVARESIRGLAAASVAARQYHTHHAPEHVVLLGLVLVAARRGKSSTEVRRARELLVGADLYPTVWTIGWHDYLIDVAVDELPSVGPDDPAVHGRRFDPRHSVAPDIAEFGREMRDRAADYLSRPPHVTDDITPRPQ